MIITAQVRLQACTTKRERYGFVQRGRDCHGIAKGRISLYQVRAESWPAIRRCLKTFEVMGFSACRRDTVEQFTEDIGTVSASLRLLVPGGGQ